MVIDPDVDPTVVEARISTAVPDDQDRRALLAPLLTAGPLPRTQPREQADGQVTLRHLEGPGQRLQDFLTREDVPLGGEISADDMPGPREALFPGIRRGAASRVDDADLALRRVFADLTSFFPTSFGAVPGFSIASASGPYAVLADACGATAPAPATANGTAAPTPTNFD